LLASFRAELLVLRKWPVAWVLVLLNPLVVLLYSYGIQYVFYLTAETGTFDLGSPDQILPTLLPGQFVVVAVGTFGSVGALPSVGTVPAVVLGALLAGGDWGRGSIKTSLSQGPGRAQTLVGQTLAVGLALAASVVLAFAVAAACSLVLGLLEAGAAASEEAAFPPLATLTRGLGVALLISAVYGAAGLALGTLFRGAGAAIAAVLIWTLVLQSLLDTLALQLGGALRTINDALPNTNALSLVNLFGPLGEAADPPGYFRADPTTAACILAGYMLAFLAVTFALVWRRDVT